jgi:hypothetical protein
MCTTFSSAQLPKTRDSLVMDPNVLTPAVNFLSAFTANSVQNKIKSHQIASAASIGGSCTGTPALVGLVVCTAFGAVGLTLENIDEIVGVWLKNERKKIYKSQNGIVYRARTKQESTAIATSTEIATVKNNKNT